MSEVLYLDWPAFSSEDAKESFKKDLGFEVHTFFHEDYTLRFSGAFDSAFDLAVKDRDISFAFSYNFYPLFAEGCHRHGIKYVSLTYDNPQVKLYSYRITYPTNYCFIFDGAEFEKLSKGGINTVYYCPLPVNSEKIDTLLAKPYNKKRTACDISFVGSLYNEEHNIYDRMYEKLGDYERGYLDALLLAQGEIYGINFLEESLNDRLTAAMHKAEDYAINKDGVETLSYIFADYYLARKLTSMDRLRYLTAVAAHYPLRLFTIDKNVNIKGAGNFGTTDYYTEMPLVFHDSRINLNISLRSIKTGIPLRCMDILGAGGFLLTNYQSDMERHFTAGEDYDYFTDEADLLAKVDYYLSHDKLRARIARNGHEKTKKYFSHKNIFSELLNIAGVRP